MLQSCSVSWPYDLKCNAIFKNIEGGTKMCLCIPYKCTIGQELCTYCPYTQSQITHVGIPKLYHHALAFSDTVKAPSITRGRLRGICKGR